jgi:DNA segregation ATPase FtsK/SpoIIIE, S-DNA-T family
LVSTAPAIRDGLVRVSGIEPKGMELAYGRRIFHRYAVTGAEALAVLDDLVEAMTARKAEFTGQVRVVPIPREHPLELVEFDELRALTKYTDRWTREAITERLALLTHPGPGAGLHRPWLCPGTHQEHRASPGAAPPANLRAGSDKSHVGMVLGDQTYERGAWANRITDAEAGVGYIFGVASHRSGR